MKPTPEELATWREIIRQCQGRYSKSINVGTGQRRAALAAIARYIEWLEIQLQAKGGREEGEMTPAFYGDLK